jgi:hypothetical protein
MMTQHRLTNNAVHLRENSDMTERVEVGVTLEIRIREVLGSNLGLDNRYHG